MKKMQNLIMMQNGRRWFVLFHFVLFQIEWGLFNCVTKGLLSDLRECACICFKIKVTGFVRVKKIFLIQKKKESPVWKDGSAVKNTPGHYIGPKFNSQHPCQVGHNCLSLQPQRVQYYLWASTYIWFTSKQICIIHANIHKIYIFKGIEFKS